MARHCSQCGTKLTEADRFCTECGAPFEVEAAAPAASAAPAAASPPPPAPEPAKAGRVPIGPIAFAVAVAGAALAGWLLLSHSGGGPAVTQAPATSVPVTPVTQAPPVVAPPSPPVAQTPQVPASPSVVSVPPTPPAPPVASTAAGATAGTWEFFSNEDGTQLLFRPAGAGAEASVPFQMSCRAEDGVISALSSAVIDDAAEKLAAAGPVVLSFSGGGQSAQGEGYIVRAPEETAIAFETLNTPALARVLSAADLTIVLPSLTVRVMNDVDRAAFRQFVAACPAPTVPAGNWGSHTNLDSAFRVEVPRDLLRVGWADRYGRVWVGRRGGAKVIVTGRVNALDDPFPAVVRKEIPEDMKPVAEIVGTDSISLAGTAGGLEQHFVGRTTCGGANVATLTITYPPAEQATWAPVVGRMERSFLSTTLPNGRPLCP